MQCGIYVEEHLEMFCNSGAEVYFTISLLKGQAHEWAMALWAYNSPLLNSGREFHRALMEVFDHPVIGRRPGFWLLDFQQGNRTAVEFSLEFRTIAANLRWPDDCLQTIFLQVLNPELQDELTHKGEAPSFDDLVQQAMRLHNTVRDRRRETHQVETPRGVPNPAVDTSVPMQVSRSPLTSTEGRRCLQGGSCLYCIGAGHSISVCPIKPRGDKAPILAGVSSLPLASLSQFTVPVFLGWGGKQHMVKAFINSGAAGNFIDTNLANQMNLPLQKLAYPISVQGVTG